MEIMLVPAEEAMLVDVLAAVCADLSADMPANELVLLVVAEVVLDETPSPCPCRAAAPATMIIDVMALAQTILLELSYYRV